MASKVDTPDSDHPVRLLGERRVALCHEWSIVLAGSETVAAEIAEVIDPDHVYTVATAPDTVRAVFGDRRVSDHTIGRNALARAHWPAMLPVLPLAWRSLDLSAYDVVFTSAHCCANAIRPPASTRLLSYCYTPMRYAWWWQDEINRVPKPLQRMWPRVATSFQHADRRWADRVDAFATSSRFVAERIADVFDREATVINPAVDLTSFTPPTSEDPPPTREFFLAAGRLVAYKRFEVAVAAANLARVPLVIAGDGPMLPALRELAGPTVRFVGRPTGPQLRDLLRDARALVFPGVEDFGILPLEAQACGTPVIARNEGGALETVIPGETGLLVDGSVESFADAMRSFSLPGDYPQRSRENACSFNATRFRQELSTFVLANV